MNSRTIKKRFFHALKRGTGEAILLLKAYPDIDFSDYIIKGALCNYAYDGQCESSRAHYIFDMIQLAPQKIKIRNAVIKGLHAEIEETWNLTHLFDLAKHYVIAGDIAMKQEIYKRFLSPPTPYTDWVGTDEIVGLDGWEGLLFIINKFGQELVENSDAWQHDSLIKSFQEQYPSIDVFAKLEKESISNPYVRAYLEEIKNRKVIWQKKRPTPIQYDDILEEIWQNSHYMSFRKIKTLTQKEINRVANQLIQETNKKRIEKLLWIFSTHPFPLSVDFLLHLAQQKVNYNYRIQEFAIDALQHFQHSAIRQFAIQRLQKTTTPSPFLKLLVNNYKKEDQKILLKIATKFKQEDIIEDLAISYIKIYQKNPTPDCKAPLEMLYSKMNCGIHRHELIKILSDNQVLSNQLLEEIKFDSHENTIKLRMSKINL